MKSQNDKPIEFLSLKKGQVWNLDEGSNKIILVLEGEIKTHTFSQLTSSNMIFYPSQDKVFITATKDSLVVSIYFYSQSGICNILNSVERSTKQQGNSISSLPVIPVVTTYACTLKEYKDKGIDSNYLLDLKVKEFGYILRNFYTNEQLQGFFSTMPNEDLNFSEKVYNHLSEVRSVRQLAEIMNYSYSGFNKRFKRSFGISAYSWITQQRRKMVYYELCNTNKSVKQISIDHRFVTLSHFNEFCHKNLGSSPSEIRRKNRIKQYT
ncbi:AraC family transcriptional regulator [Dysgonomonas sp. 520]|uniref:helix-turn-helix domain-containing protein n=1 Tax=Dysgonomonas sp. 520 TaxID=2302931 RepID=UPI0013D16A21|nr:AraC family transcriptional regulator [Dysgonomonas sp. 520]NDW09022.1 AraC family transcriptional regulator [Dysgonomonas sp. 520]